MNVKETLDRTDGTNILVLQRSNLKETYNNLNTFSKAFSGCLDVTNLVVRNHYMKFSTEACGDRMYVLFWSDVCKLMRDGEATVYSYKYLTQE